MIDKTESRGTNPGSKSSKKSAAVSTEGKRPLKTARTGAPSDMRRLEDIPVPCRKVMEDKKVELTRLVRARDGKDDTVLSLVWGNAEVIPYMRQGSRFLDARRFGALPSHGQASRTMYAGLFFMTVFRAWQLCQEGWGKVKEHAAAGVDMPVLRYKLEALYIY